LETLIKTVEVCICLGYGGILSETGYEIFLTAFSKIKLIKVLKGVNKGRR